MSEDTTGPFTFRVEISPEHVDAIAPRLREALAASGNDGDMTRRAAAVAEREEKLRRDQEELERRARQLTEREAELGSSTEMTASERIRFAERRHHIELSEHEIESRSDELLHREAEFEADVILREDRLDHLGRLVLEQVGPFEEAGIDGRGHWRRIITPADSPRGRLPGASAELC